MVTALLAVAFIAPVQAGKPLPSVQFVVEGKGTFDVLIRTDQAPKIGGHFLDLVDRGFYNRQLFHRKVKDFVVQGGDPLSKRFTPAKARSRPGEHGGTKGLGEGGSGKSIAYEINDLVHDRYTVGMALEAPMSDTGDSQFFINLKNNYRLNGMYCVFGKVTRGFDVIDNLDRGDRIVRVKRI